MNPLIMLLPILTTVVVLVSMPFLDSTHNWTGVLSRKENREPAELKAPVLRAPRTSSNGTVVGSSQAGIPTDATIQASEMESAEMGEGGRTASLLQSLYSMVEFIARANMSSQGYLIGPLAGQPQDKRDRDDLFYNV